MGDSSAAATSPSSNGDTPFEKDRSDSSDPSDRSRSAIARLATRLKAPPEKPEVAPPPSWPPSLCSCGLWRAKRP